MTWVTPEMALIIAIVWFLLVIWLFNHTGSDMTFDTALYYHSKLESLEKRLKEKEEENLRNNGGLP